MKCTTSHQQVVRQKLNNTDSSLTVLGALVITNIQNPQLLSNCMQQYQAPHIQSMDLTDPVSIINAAAVFLTAGDYGTTVRVLEILDKHLILPENVLT